MTRTKLLSILQEETDGFNEQSRLRDDVLDAMEEAYLKGKREQLDTTVVSKRFIMKHLIEELKKAKHESKVGGIYHSIEFYKVESKAKDIIKNLQIKIEKPEYVHYNSIIDWYHKNQTYLDSVNV